MDTRFLDVAIGLVLVFALTSLMVSAMTELLNTSMQMRPRMLKRAVDSILGDDAGLTTDFYAQPVIRAMYEGVPGSQSALQDSLMKGVSAMFGMQNGPRLPSYIDADEFCTALFAMLQQKGELTITRGQGTPADFLGQLRTRFPVSPAMGAATQGMPVLLASLESLSAGVAQDWPGFEARVKQWYNACVARASGWFVRNTQKKLFGVGLFLAAVLNINPITIAQALWLDPVLRASTVSAAQGYVADSTAAQNRPAQETAKAESGAVAVVPLPAASQAVLAAIPADATPVQRAYALTGQRLTDLIGLLGEFAPPQHGLMVTASRLRKGLEYEHSIRAMPDINPTLLKDQLEANERVFNKLQEDVARIPMPSSEGAKEVLRRTQDTLPQLRKSIDNERAMADKAAQPKPKALAKTSTGCTKIPVVDILAYSQPSDAAAPAPSATASSMESAKQQFDTAYGNLCALGLPMGWGEAEKRQLAMLQGAAFLSAIGMYMLGFLIVAAASTLGAPFWFDFLGRLVKLRGTGGKPTDSDTTDTGKTAADKGSGQTTNPAATQNSPFQDALNEVEDTLTVSEKLNIQQTLGLPNDKITGRLDGFTRDAISRWHQRRNPQDKSNELTEADLAELIPNRSRGVLGLPNTEVGVNVLGSASVVSVAAGQPTPHSEHDEETCPCELDKSDPTEDQHLPVSQGG